ncbi:sulfotransferase [Colwellia sp. MB02u-10]|uniref:tetratricopeptide repeat-containing sulfotransferase family protein n=1 Tax=Colwellia sp. MB02u-10 TaxID=2759828 RepID=UPI0015F64657|nr:sulfotransferase [Colwellia sp. MB02u-10]MBA6340440.1 sulfotransferase [Colwellia sp. MB02u-10]
MAQTISVLHQQAQQAINKSEYRLAHQCLIKILQQDKHFSDAYFLLAMIASVHHNIDKAILLIEQAIVLAPNNSEFLAQLAKHYALSKNHLLALKNAKSSQTLNPTSALTWDTLGVTYSQIGLHQLAVPCFEKAIKKDKTVTEYFFNLGASQKFNGDFIGARTNYEQCVLLSPMHCKAHAALTSLGQVSASDNHIPALEHLHKNIAQTDNLLYISHALAREYEALKNYDKAFHYLQNAKQKKLTQLDYSINDDKTMFTALEQTLKQQQDVKKGFASSEALFVVGMPRSGTTLVERIISQHSEVTSAGELQHFGLLLKKMTKTTTNKVIDAETVQAACNIDFCQLGKDYIDSTRAITGKTAKFVDKMPLNFLYVGFILQALPNAKIICLDRNPLDTIVSNFRQLFAVNFSYYNYAYDLSTTAEFYVLFKKLISFWLELYPDNFYIVNYEQLVNNPEAEAKKLVEFCALSWQEACLHINDNKAPVATASALQVREPINNKSIGNWQKYDKYLDEVKALLTKNHGL